MGAGIPLIAGGGCGDSVSRMTIISLGTPFLKYSSQFTCGFRPPDLGFAIFPLRGSIAEEDVGVCSCWRLLIPLGKGFEGTGPEG